MPFQKAEAFQPSYPAWTAEFLNLTEIIFAQIGVQSKQTNPQAFYAIAQSLGNAKHIERAFFQRPTRFS